MKKIIVSLFVLIFLFITSQWLTVENPIETKVLINGDPPYDTVYVTPFQNEFEVNIISKLSGTCEICVNPMNASISPSCLGKQVTQGKNTFRFLLSPEQNITRLFIEYKVSCNLTNYLTEISILQDELLTPGVRWEKDR